MDKHHIMRLKQNARDYYAKNENDMTEERKQQFKKIIKEFWREELQCSKPRINKKKD